MAYSIDLQKRVVEFVEEGGQHFVVQINAIWYALRQLNITCKKNSAVR